MSCLGYFYFIFHLKMSGRESLQSLRIDAITTFLVFFKALLIDYLWGVDEPRMPLQKGENQSNEENFKNKSEWADDWRKFADTKKSRTDGRTDTFKKCIAL